MAPTFGITATNFSYRFSGQSFTGWETQVTLWVNQAAAELAIILRQQGRDADDVEGTSDLYYLCGRYIEHSVMIDIARAQTRQDPEIARAAMMERDRIEQKIRSHNESLEEDTFDKGTMMGVFRTGGGRRGGGGKRWAMGGKC